MVKTIVWFSYFWLHLIATCKDFIKVKLLELKGKEKQARNYVNQLAYNWARKMVELTGSQVEVEGLDKIPEEPVLFAANHQGAFDIPLLLGYIDKPKSFIAKWELRYFPLLGTWMKQIECIFIKRGNPRQILNAYKNAGEIFAKGQSLVVFPEGTRSRSNNLASFKQGSFKIALREDVPVVPVTIKGSYKLREGNGGYINGDQVELIISDPIYPEQLEAKGAKGRSKLAQQVEGIIRENLDCQ